MNSATILICTHNRATLLADVLASLNAAQRPTNWQVDILVAANACTDNTPALLEQYRARAERDHLLPLMWFAEPQSGKSFALNSAIARLKADIIAFVDDDHRVDSHFLVALCAAAEAYPGVTMFCGRILPDWDGTEPAWVHDEGPYKIRPLPIPRSDNGELPKRLTANDPTPGGGNLFLRREVFDRVGGFPTELGPHGHDLGGGEDSVFLSDALTRGETLQYIPGVLQYHRVDRQRLSLSYLLRKAYQRSRSVARAYATGHRIPLYMWRKLAQYTFGMLFSLNWPRTRYYLVRVAVTLGEMRGMHTHLPAGSPPLSQSLTRTWLYLFGLTGAVMMGLAAAPQDSQAVLHAGIASALIAALIFALLLAAKSVADYSQTGPRIRADIRRYYRFYTAFTFVRLLAYAFVILTIMSAAGVILYASAISALGATFSFIASIIAGASGILILTALQFCRRLLFLP
ncbi:MAG: glycosyltransferase family 2 protein, partial [Gammaproteobacteria bacterium]